MAGKRGFVVAALVMSIASIARADLSVLYGNRIRNYDFPTGTFLGDFGVGGEGGGGIHWAPDDNLYFVSWSVGMGHVIRTDAGFDGGFLAAPTIGLIMLPQAMKIGPDGHIYVGAGVNTGQEPPPPVGVHRYDSTTGLFVDLFLPLNMTTPGVYDLAFTDNGTLFASWNGGIARRDGVTDAINQAFIPVSPGVGLGGMAIGPDGNLYVADAGNDSVLKFNPVTGALIGTFVASGAGGLDQPFDIEFGPDGNLYVSSIEDVLRFNGLTGAFIDVFADTPPASQFSGGTAYLSFGPEIPEPAAGVIGTALLGLFGLARRRSAA